MANKAYKFRLYPTQEQEQLLAKTFGCVRFVYNKMLEERIHIYEKLKDDKEALKQHKFPTPAKYKRDFPWLKEVDSLALANAQLNLQKAFTNFFSGRAGFPKFKSRKTKQSYTTNVVNGNIKLANGYIKLPKLKWVKLKQHRQIPVHHIIKSCTITKTKTGKYFISILTEYEHQPVPKEIENVVGLDFSMNTLYVDSEGKRANYPRFYRQALEKLTRALRFGQSIHDNGWGMFTTFLQYKLAEQGKKLIKIDKWFPSSKTCSCCGRVKVSLSLSERLYRCACGFVADRDTNAAINIKKEGLKQLGTA
ncbi:transposase [Caldalkalibacillus thermarum TA2.A1]|uniref:Transposase n=2 Tax=Caldalkalibacillus thermarum (strain TA2.A1) TaxID=986075 RepID=A0A8X8I3Y8_CALTT|nr:RNA-guided endonuclease TnpB family protein [Caldalkalibacillus thermarum]QZT33906.1 transposase [Caldalkalibacillus thermarum TA2.A1]